MARKPASFLINDLLAVLRIPIVLMMPFFDAAASEMVPKASSHFFPIRLFPVFFYEIMCIFLIKNWTIFV